MKNWLFLLTISILLFSCTDKDGDWDPMIWNNKNNIEVPQAGKSYIFMNYNYESFWVYAINGTENIIDNGQKYEDNCISIRIEKNIMTVTVFPNEGHQIRTISIRPFGWKLQKNMEKSMQKHTFGKHIQSTTLAVV